MNYNSAAKTEALLHYAVLYIDAPMFPEIERFIYRNRKTIYVNLAARSGANIVKLVL